jgi:dihydrofolate reductase
MGKVVLGMMLSLDGYINDAEGSVALLYPDFETIMQSEPMQESIRTTGAVVMGRRTFEMGDPDAYADSYEYQVPLFVVTHHPPEKQPKRNDRLYFTFVTDGVESAVAQAKAAAGDKNVMVVGGPDIAQTILNAGLADELQIGLMPVLLGGGQPFFGALDHAPVKLEKTRVIETGERTELWFKVLK